MRTYHREIIFSDKELTKGFRYKDIFQIKPSNFEKQPKSTNIKIYPLLLEYWSDSDENPIVADPKLQKIKDFVSRNANQLNKKQSILNLLTSITNFNFFYYGNGIKWSIPFPEEITDEFNNETSVESWDIYYYPKMADDLRITEFTEVDYESISLIKDYYYYTHPDIFSSITFPKSIEQILDSYYAVEGNKKKTIDAVLKLIKDGVEIFEKYKSLSFLSFISAIETLVDLEYYEENKMIEYSCEKCKSLSSSHFVCTECGNPIWAVSYKFKEFLKKYISDTNGSISKFNKIYNLRSKIVHSGSLMLGENNISVWEEPDKTKKEFIVHIETMQLSRLSLIKWLLSNRQEKQ
ncbi:MAG: hypothetical protein A2X13_08415 [Bacteroidetes bacterium GWC2_33_15]|nr:MAG: hypothetical protein A2X10_10245 [Bacteroidetes bacterium GWA2_33_15]OFX51476.1 MAG: hypothetical protein A2X13_08415 [Bacteroidetes bacterium GWC2_33_15]OFX65777.1 MAG: hypothetical protein A2X15_13360 [Bacteroidetes bacterium GWB2_32_14]OFX69504.1 MAG: hypothetical protein A2X14_09995 [Bacteroidetes bacterium GWD2_33_33]HAN17763.1 hypothetical protein [Bacteroidales bacterium]